MGCPWSGLAPANLTFCEESLCGWVTQPANTWSNVGFLAVGAWILHLARREHRATAGLLGWIALATGIASAACHGTSTLVGQLLDQSVMFLESAFFVIFDLRRWRAWPSRSLVVAYLSVVSVSVALLLTHPTAGIALFVTHIAVFLALELRLYFRDGAATSYRPIALAGLTFAVSWAVWWLDRLGILCDPHDHVFNGHALWHLLGALSFLFWYRHFSQFEPR